MHRATAWHPLLRVARCARLHGRYALPAAVARAQVAAALRTVGLAAVAQRPTHTLSGGQRQRCAIAGALAQAPKVDRGCAGNIALLHRKLGVLRSPD